MTQKILRSHAFFTKFKPFSFELPFIFWLTLQRRSLAPHRYRPDISHFDERIFVNKIKTFKPAHVLLTGSQSDLKISIREGLTLPEGALTCAIDPKTKNSTYIRELIRFLEPVVSLYLLHSVNLTHVAHTIRWGDVATPYAKLVIGEVTLEKESKCVSQVDVVRVDVVSGFTFRFRVKFVHKRKVGLARLRKNVRHSLIQINDKLWRLRRLTDGHVDNIKIVALNCNRVLEVCSIEWQLNIGCSNHLCHHQNREKENPSHLKYIIWVALPQKNFWITSILFLNQ